MKKVILILCLTLVFSTSVSSQVKGGDIYGKKPIDFADFYAQASVELLSNQLREGQTLGNKNRDSRDFDLHHKWAINRLGKNVATGPIAEELIDKFKKMVDIKAEEGRESLAHWYSMVCIAWVKYKINFGSDEANSLDFDLHKNWAIRQTPNVIQDQILMRIQKILEAKQVWKTKKVQQ